MLDLFYFFQDATDDTQVVLYKNDGTGKSVGWDYYTGYSQGLFITSIIGMDAGDTVSFYQIYFITLLYYFSSM